MKTEPYSRFANEELILRDLLAMDRTALANERTLLSYIRSALALAAAGAGLIHFLDAVLTEILGWALIPLAAALAVVGVQRYLQMRKRLSTVLNKADTKGT
jgi:putative membrane protein